jgi:UDP-glucose 4-epimerase
MQTPPSVVGVTGCAGFLGSHLVDALLARGHRVVGLDNLAFGRLEHLAAHRDNPHFAFAQVDVTDAAQVQALLAPCDALVHLAAHKIPRYGNALETLRVNAEGTRAVLEVARWRASQGLPVRVALASTSDVYGKSPLIPFAEEQDLFLGPSHVPRWAYASSKLFDEHMGFAYHDECNFPVALMRFFGAYGPRHHLSWWGGPQSVFLTALLRKQPLTIHGDGQQTRTFTYVEDSVRGILACLDRNAGCEVYNIGSDQTEITIEDFARLLHRLVRAAVPSLGLPEAPALSLVPYQSFSARPYEDVRRRVPDTRKARERLGFAARVGLEEGLRHTIAWHLAALEEAPDA